MDATTSTVKTAQVLAFSLFGILVISDHDATAMFLGLMGATTRLLWRSPATWRSAVLGTFLGIMLAWHLGLALLEYIELDNHTYVARFVLFTIGFSSNMIATAMDGMINRFLEKPIENLLRLLIRKGE